ncbi:MAG: hypothetical protein ACRDAM_11135 [Casimicrobium sp.]
MQASAMTANTTTLAPPTKRASGAARNVIGAGARVSLGMIAFCALLAQAQAVITDLSQATQAQHQLRIKVGSQQNSVDTVSFGTIPGASVGNGTPVPALDRSGIEISVYAWTPGSNERSVVLTANSSVGMHCVTTTSCGNTAIPFDTVSWTSRGGDIRAGRFDLSANQHLARANSDRTMKSTLFFRYANATVYPAGTYRGRVTFTASMP